MYCTSSLYILHSLLFNLKSHIYFNITKHPRNRIIFMLAKISSTIVLHCVDTSHMSCILSYVHGEWHLQEVDCCHEEVRGASWQTQGEGERVEEEEHKSCQRGS